MRHVPPALSPLGARDLLAGAAALAGLDRGDPAASILRDLRAAALLLLDSGTSALTLALRAARQERPGAPVALPAYCCYDIATAADGADAPVILYDLDPGSLGPDPASLSRALAAGAGAVVVAHLYGMPVDVPAVMAEARATGALVIEDAAQGAGGSLGGSPLGAMGDLSVLSFGRGKGVTGGSGGALVARDAARAASLAAGRGQESPLPGSASDWIKLVAQWVLGRPALYALPAGLPFLGLGDTTYRAPRPPEAMRRVAARVVVNTWRGREAEAEVRRRNAAWLLGRAPAALQSPRAPSGAVPGYLRLPFVVPDAARAAMLTPRARRLGVMPGYPLSLSELPGFAGRCRNAGADLPGAKALAARLVTLPTHSLVSPADRQRLADWLAAQG